MNGNDVLREKLRPLQSVPSDVADRYSRHLLLRDFGVEGQAVLRRSRVVMIGAGGLGSSFGLYAGGSGLGSLTIVDGDAVSLSNLHRQVAHSIESCERGENKAESLGRRIRDLNREIELRVFPVFLSEENAEFILSGHDVVVDCLDNYSCRFLLNRFCHAHSVPLLHASVQGWEGQLSLLNYRGGPCYECLVPSSLPTPLDPIPIIGPLPGVIGSLQAMELIKLLTDSGELAFNQLLLYDGRRCSLRKIQIRRRDNCPLCGAPPSPSPSPVPLPALPVSAFLSWRDLVSLPAFLLVDLRSDDEKRLSRFESSVVFSSSSTPLETLLSQWESAGRPLLCLFCRDGRKSESFFRTLETLMGNSHSLRILTGGLTRYREEIDSQFFLA